MKTLVAEGSAHPAGEAEEVEEGYAAPRKLDTFGGLVEGEWEEDGAAGMHGGLVNFVEFLKVSGLWESLV